MVSVTQLQRQYAEYTTSLYHEGYLNDQFMQLQKLQDESDPDFLVGLVSVFVDDSKKLLDTLTTAFIGAQRLMRVCVLFINYCKEKNLDGCLWCLQQANHEYILVRSKFKALFKLEKQILKAGGSIPMME
uniref:Histidine-containing phosphotransfer protein n=1 Tax=Lactuca sativa TaxID=4236 RepID=A0A9R1W671_LACSA|nr:hypothetical protein LSAT_V11C300143110 [Lactuca sativa]